MLILSATTTEALWLWLDRISILLSYVVVGSIFAFVLNLYRYSKLRRRLARIAGRTRRPRGLAIAVGGGSIKTAFSQELKRLYPDARIPVKEHLAGEITAQNIHKHEEALRMLKERFQTEGVTELHIAFKGPVALAIAVGAIFDNWVSVKLYQHDREGKYVSWTSLAAAKALPIADEVAEKTLDMVGGKE